jgi:probable phosphoglycerate mutase
MTKIILVRHGQTAWNKEERFRGQHDIPLDDTGKTQAQLTAQHIAAHWQPAAVIASPLSRTQQTAAPIAQLCGLTVQSHPNLRDINYGVWTGLLIEEAQEKYPQLIKAWFDAPHTVVIPQGESLAMVRERAMQAVQELVNQYPNETIVLVSHTVVNRLILLGMLGIGNELFWQLRQEPCAINLIDWQGGNLF